MPTYEYLCGSCEHHFEQVQKISEDSLTKCPDCGKNELKRVINATAFHLKGSGWYKTDYASGSSSSSAPSPSTPAQESGSTVEKKDDSKVKTTPTAESAPSPASSANSTSSTAKS